MYVGLPMLPANEADAIDLGVAKERRELIYELTAAECENLGMEDADVKTKSGEQEFDVDGSVDDVEEGEDEEDITFDRK